MYVIYVMYVIACAHQYHAGEVSSTHVVAAIALECWAEIQQLALIESSSLTP